MADMGLARRWEPESAASLTGETGAGWLPSLFAHPGMTAHAAPPWTVPNHTSLVLSLCMPPSSSCHQCRLASQLPDAMSASSAMQHTPRCVA